MTASHVLPLVMLALSNVFMTFAWYGHLKFTNLPLLKHIASTGKPILMSTGMATLEEVAEAVVTVRDAGNNALVLLHCEAVIRPRPRT